MEFFETNVECFTYFYHYSAFVYKKLMLKTCKT